MAGIINLLLTFLNLALMMFSYSQGNYMVAMFNSFVAGIGFMATVIIVKDS